MAVSYKKLLHLMIEKDISNTQLMREANISANIITKLRTGQYIALDKVECICKSPRFEMNYKEDLIIKHKDKITV